MKRHYPWLWFDADGTLFDYNRAEANALRKAFELLNLHFEDSYLDTYQQINHSLWQALERQEIKPDVLRVRRFESLLETLGLRGSHEQLSAVYVEQLGLCTDLIDGAYEVLQVLHKSCKCIIITNGLQSVQRSRLAHSAIRDFISEIIISEEIGAAKPSPAYFDIAFARTGYPAKNDVLVVGDSLTSDIQGGVDYGLDTCWYNPNGGAKPGGLQITYEIRRLRDLLDVVD